MSSDIAVLVVAPETGLKFVRREVEAIVNTSLDVTIVPSPVTKAAFAQALRERKYNIWCILTHGVRNNDAPWESGVLMEDDLMNTSVLATYAKVYKPDLILLNTCSSDDVARLVMQTSGADVVCTVIDVPDEQAFITGRLLMQQIAEHGDYRRAYEESKPADNRVYLYLTGYDIEDAKTRSGRSPQRRIDDQGEELAHVVESLVRAIQGDEFGGNVGLITEIKLIGEQTRKYIEEDRIWKLKADQRMEANRLAVTKVEAELAQMRAKHGVISMSSVFWVVGILVFFLLAIGNLLHLFR